MGKTTKREYSAPSLVEYGKLEEITRGTGYNFLDFLWGKDDGNPWGLGGGGKHSST